MSHIKKTLSLFLVAALLCGGLWYINSAWIIGELSSSVLNTSTFSCTEQSIKSQAPLYHKIVMRHKKAIDIKKKLEREIALLKKSDPKSELQKKEEILKILSRQINIYYRSIKKYETCKKEIKFNPTVSPGMMSGEAKVRVSEKEYQALAAFKISSSEGLNTYVQSIQFDTGILPDLGIMVDKWFLLHEGANPIECQISGNVNTIDCALFGDMPVDIMSGMSRTYGIAPHITSIYGSGTVDIQISKIFFNDGRISTIEHIASPLLSFGVVAPVVEEVSASTQVATPSTLPVVETPAQTVATPSVPVETTTPPATTEVSDPVVQPSAESIVPVSSEAPTSSDIPAVVPVITETQVPAETIPPASSDTTTTNSTTTTSPSTNTPPVPSSEASSETPLAASSETV